MRITNAMLSNNMLSNVNRSMNTLDKYYMQMSSGKKIQVPSDDPLIASRALRYRTIISDNRQYSENVEQATSWLSITSTSLANMTSILTRMRELCTEAANDTETQDDRAKILAEYTSLNTQLEDEINTTYNGRYIFSGFKTNTSPVTKSEDGDNILNPLVYGENGTEDLTKDQNINIEVSTGIYMNVNSFATQIYPLDTYNILHSFDERYSEMLKGEDVNQTVLRNDFDNMQKKLDEIMAVIAKEETSVGVKAARMDLTETRLEENYANYTSLQAENEDVNYNDASMNYNTANAVYSAALKVGMNINQLTLADYL